MSAARHAYGQSLYREPWDVPRMTAPSHSRARDQTLSAKYQFCIRFLLLEEPIIPQRPWASMSQVRAILLKVETIGTEEVQDEEGREWHGGTAV
jgi:hypothetical protein